MLKSTRLVISLHFHDCCLVSLPLNLCFSGLLSDGYVMTEGRRKRKREFSQADIPAPCGTLGVLQEMYALLYLSLLCLLL